ncbi:MAG: enoyl-CoA hydratase/isomerase family protein [Thermodesulfobacteriota bacterium]|nr:enoyl-CoA hydratase/isomerase family protein [Thermodesulfobacteriota bacterium]
MIKELPVAYETVIVERRGEVGIIKLNRPQQRNALNVRLATDILDALHELENDTQTRVIVMTSAVPGVFCAGRDLAELVSLRDADALEQRKAFDKIAEIMLTIPAMKKMVIAAVSGYVLAGGCGLAACCDLMIAAEDAVFGMPEIDVGLFPLVVAPVMMRSIGLRKCLELFSTGDRIDAREAERG